MENQLFDVHATIKSLEQQQISSTDDIVRLQSERDALNVEMVRLAALTTQLQEQKQELEENVNLHKIRCDELQNKLTHLTDENIDAKEQIITEREKTNVQIAENANTAQGAIIYRLQQLTNLLSTPTHSFAIRGENSIFG